VLAKPSQEANGGKPRSGGSRIEGRTTSAVFSAGERVARKACVQKNRSEVGPRSNRLEIGVRSEQANLPPTGGDRFLQTDDRLVARGAAVGGRGGSARLCQNAGQQGLVTRQVVIVHRGRTCDLPDDGNRLPEVGCRDRRAAQFLHRQPSGS